MGRYFGTDGVRGRFGLSLNETMAYRIGRFIGGDGFAEPKRVLLGRDTRESGPILSEELRRGILDAGGTVYDLGVTSTPSVSFLVQKDHLDYGIMVSASHNPYADNGIKVFNGLGEKLESAIEARIEDYMDLPSLPEAKSGGDSVDASSLKEEYLEWLLSKVSPKVKGLRVIADLANGSASALAPVLFQRMGLNATFIGCDPDGRNINENCGSTHIDGLVAEYQRGHYDLGLCFDGDADRFMGVWENGRIIDGDAQIFLSGLAMRAAGTLHQNKVVITVMSNLGLRKALQAEGIEYDIVSVGDKYVQARLKEGGLSLGGEQSGHVIYLDELNTGDGLLSAIHLLNLYVDQPDIFQKIRLLRVYPQLLKNVRREERAEIERVLASPNVRKAIDKVSQELGDEGRLLVRPSGTEPLIRVMAEARDMEECTRVVDEVIEAIQGV